MTEPINPKFGPIEGDTKVTIKGHYLDEAEVLFGKKYAIDVVECEGECEDENSIVATSPPGCAGTVSITVITSGGEFKVQNAFTYLESPKVTEVVPAQGSVDGGTTVTIKGTDLKRATKVAFGSNDGKITKRSEDQITVTSPKGDAKTVDITVITPGGEFSLPSAFTYVALPSVISLNPNQGAAAEVNAGKIISIYGSNFIGDTITVHFAKQSAEARRINNETIWAIVPKGQAGSVPVTVTTVGGVSNKNIEFKVS
jgi:hypothetical protein